MKITIQLVKIMKMLIGSNIVIYLKHKLERKILKKKKKNLYSSCKNSFIRHTYVKPAQKESTDLGTQWNLFSGMVMVELWSPVHSIIGTGNVSVLG